MGMNPKVNDMALMVGFMALAGMPNSKPRFSTVRNHESSERWHEQRQAKRKKRLAAKASRKRNRK